MTYFSETSSYYNKETGVSIRVPKSWTGKVLHAKAFRLFGEQEPGFEDFFDEYRPTMSFEVVAMELHDKAARETFIQTTNLKMTEDYNAFKMGDEQWLQIGGHEAYLKHYSWTEEESELELEQLQGFIFINPYALLLVNAAVLKPLKEKYMPAFDAVLSSTRLIPA